MKESRTGTWANRITYCTRCKSTIYWDDSSNPQMLQFGNENVLHCMETGCALIYMGVPPGCCAMEELNLVRLGLQEIGISESDARTLALKLCKTAAAA